MHILLYINSIYIYSLTVSIYLIVSLLGASLFKRWAAVYHSLEQQLSKTKSDQKAA